jgi:hypothetical protein
MSASALANTTALAATITPDLAAVLHDAKPHPQLGPVRAPAPSSAQLGKAAAALAAGLAAEAAAGPNSPAVSDAAELVALRASYLLPPGTRARVHRAGPEGVLVLAPSDGPRAVATAGPGLYVVVEASPHS